ASTAHSLVDRWLMTIFGCPPLLLAAVGMYGLTAYSVQQRTKEIGIRLALGANSGTVRNMVVAQGMILAGSGVSLGIALRVRPGARLLATFLFGVTAARLRDICERARSTWRCRSLRGVVASARRNQSQSARRAPLRVATI